MESELRQKTKRHQMILSSFLNFVFFKIKCFGLNLEQRKFIFTFSLTMKVNYENYINMLLLDIM